MFTTIRNSHPVSLYLARLLLIACLLVTIFALVRGDSLAAVGVAVAGVACASFAKTLAGDRRVAPNQDHS